MAKQSSREKLYEECREKLLSMREDRMNGLQSLQESLQDKITGDEGDMAHTLETQHTSLVQRERMIQELREIEFALKRLQEGSYGVCEETGEDIEKERLLAIPWTRLSIEGAESRETQKKRFA